MADNIRIEQRKEPAAMQVYSGACGDATSREEGTPMPAQPVCGHGCGCSKTRDCSHGDNLKSKKKIMFVEYLSNSSNAGALRAPALL
jgi:hypothetical protein